MGTHTVRSTFRVNGSLTTPTTAKLSDATGTYGIKRNDTSAVIVADGTSMTAESLGVYTYTFTYVDGVAYTAWVEFVYDGNTYRQEYDFPAVETDTAGSMTVSFTQLRERVARFAFGQRTTTGLTTAQVDDIDACIQDGLQSVYSAHKWSFLRPRTTITTAASDYTYDLPVGYDGIEGNLTYPDDDGGYPPVRMVKESEIRRLHQNAEYSDRPTKAAIVTASYNATTGSKREIIFYPTPDGIYVLTGKMILRPTMIDADNPYPLGGELLAPVIIESCLAAAERTFRDTEEIHGAKYKEMLALAIKEDQDRACPETLGFDPATMPSMDTLQECCCHLGTTVYINSIEM